MAAHIAGGKYLRIELTNSEGARKFYVHVLVAEAFLGPCPAGYEIDHKNLNKRDACLFNLEYVTHRENVDRFLRARGCSDGSFKAGDSHRGAKLSDADALAVANSREPVAVLANRFNVAEVTIIQVQNGKNWSTVTGIKPKATSGKPRRCPICKVLGHNSRTCAQRKAA